MVFVLPGGWSYHRDKMCQLIGRRNRPELVELHESRITDYDYEPCSRCGTEPKQASPQQSVTRLDEVGPGEHDEYFFKTRRKGYFNEDMKFVEGDEVWVTENGMPGVIERAPGYKKSVRGSEVGHHYRVKFWPESDPTNTTSKTFSESELTSR